MYMFDNIQIESSYWELWGLWKRLLLSQKVNWQSSFFFSRIQFKSSKKCFFIKWLTTGVYTFLTHVPTLVIPSYIILKFSLMPEKYHSDKYDNEIDDDDNNYKQ